MRGQFSRSYNHNPAHFKFPRTIEGIVEDSNQRATGDVIVAVISIMIIVLAVCAYFVVGDA
jgi:hypothetical protein